MHHTRAFQRGAAVGALVLTFAGLAWSFVALANHAGSPKWAFWACAAVVAGLGGRGVWQLVRIQRSPVVEVSAAESLENARRGRRMGMWFGLVFMVEGVLIGAAAVTLGAMDRPLLVPVVAVAIVGVHFIPLARIFQVPAYAVGGVVMTVLAGLSLLIPDEGLRVYVLGISSAVVLWGMAGWVLGR